MLTLVGQRNRALVWVYIGIRHHLANMTELSVLIGDANCCCHYCNNFSLLGSLLWVPCNALTLLSGWQEGYPTHKKPMPLIHRVSDPKLVKVGDSRVSANRFLRRHFLPTLIFLPHLPFFAILISWFFSLVKIWLLPQIFSPVDLHFCDIMSDDGLFAGVTIDHRGNWIRRRLSLVTITQSTAASTSRLLLHVHICFVQS